MAHDLDYDDRSTHEDEQHRHAATRKPRTSAAAAFALFFGTIALVAALTAILSPVALVFGTLAIVFALAGIGRARRPGVTGGGVAIGGLVLGMLGVLVSASLLAGAVTVLNNQDQVDRVNRQLDKMRDRLPTQVPTDVPNRIKNDLPSPH